MKKILLAGLLVTGLMAVENENYFGINAGNAKLSYSTDTANADTDGAHYTATVGHYYGNDGRISASYTYINRENSVDAADLFSIAYDFMLPLAEDKFSLYAGPVIGYTSYKESANTLNLDLSGFHYGAQAGAIFRVVDSVEIEAGYRFLMETGSDTVADVEINADDVRMWYVGANLRF
ncbi:MAG: porin family protein [Sulfurimonas sp.]|jgi:hypothetical protein|nr:porin family protein [Sulfurimonas sp.]MBU3938826.1 porin family protein [bacterium]MBU4024986.1 porin family protein [bacterium]MBU4059452.1 porin family protein [bacterium]MBU4110176.1 porin family protein [bacterium]